MPVALCDETLHTPSGKTNKHSFFALTYPFERRVNLFKLIKTVNQWAGLAAGLGVTVGCGGSDATPSIREGMDDGEYQGRWHRQVGAGGCACMVCNGF